MQVCAGLVGFVGLGLDAVVAFEQVVLIEVVVVVVVVVDVLVVNVVVFVVNVKFCCDDDVIKG